MGLCCNPLTKAGSYNGNIFCSNTKTICNLTDIKEQYFAVINRVNINEYQTSALEILFHRIFIIDQYDKYYYPVYKGIN